MRTTCSVSQTLLEHGFTVTFRKVYTSPYIHRHMVTPFAKIVTDTYLETRSEAVSI